jgi:hypothetical protein
MSNLRLRDHADQLNTDTMTTTVPVQVTKDPSDVALKSTSHRRYS